jgi:hypothetical protein
MKKFLLASSILILLLFSFDHSYAGTLGDINGDGKITLAEAIYALQVIAGIRVQTNLSNETLSGPWISSGNYLIFDGKGIVTEFSIFNLQYPAGTYQVQPDGAVTMTIYAKTDGTLGPFNGNLISSNELQMFSYPFIRIADISTCQGTWSGTLTAQNIQTPSPPSPSIQFTVDKNGIVTSFTGLALPVAGKMFCESNKAIAHFTTAETNSYQEIVFKGVLSNNNITGNYLVSNGSANDPDGTLTLNRLDQSSTACSNKAGNWGGTYSGTACGNTDNGPVIVTINSNCSAQINFTSHSISGPCTVSGDNMSCSITCVGCGTCNNSTGTVNLSGTISGNNIAGTYSGTDASVTGTWSAIKQ